MKNFFLTLFIIVVTIPTAIAQSKTSSLVVLELFTSQGCSSCPPADALLKRTKNENTTNVIALSYHVDYWDYIGWKDPFSKAEYTKKQQKYGRKFVSNSIYTPQVVVNGKTHFVGSNANLMRKNLEAFSKTLPKNGIKISNIIRNKLQIKFNYDISGVVTNKYLRVNLVLTERTTSVARGENKNRILKNSNIVIEEVYIELEDKTGTAKLEIPAIANKNDELAIVAIVQSKNLDITGGTQVAL